MRTCCRLVLLGSALSFALAGSVFAQVGAQDGAARQPGPQGAQATVVQPRMTPGTPQPAPQRRLLMQTLEDEGLAGPLTENRINIYGHVEGSYTWNFDDPDSDINAFRIFDFEHDEPLLNQLDLSIERMVDYRRAEWDVGFHIEMMYGADAGIIHSDGMAFGYDGPRDPDNQFDLTQAYVDVAVPVGTGLRIRAGKFVNFVGYETINPTTGGIVDFYSRSLIFFQYPFTHTGVVGTYDLSDDVTLTAGFSRGDNRSTDDNNDAISFLGSINWVLNDNWALYFSNSTGPEQTDDNGDLRSTWDATLYFTPSDDLTAAFNIYYVFENDAVPSGAEAEDGNLIALALLAAFDLNEHFTLKGRVEWVHDDEGFRLGADVEDIYEITVGLTIRPFPNDRIGRNLKIRPEVRWDHSPDGPFDDGDDDQFTAAIDAIFTF